MAIEQEQKKESPSHKEFQSLLDKDFKDKKIKENEITKATVTEITKNFVICDIKGAKQEAHIPIEEFKQNGELDKLKVNSEVSVYIDRLENFKGEIVVSRDKARKMVAWKRVLSLFETQEVATGYLRNRVKGGYVCEIDGLSTFMPSSQLSIRPLKNIDHLLNVPIEVKITRVDTKRGNACSSRRQVISESKQAEITKALKNIKEGDIVEDAVVKATLEWGIFLDINGIDALLHVSDLSHGRVKKPSDLVTIGQKIKVKITKIDPKTNRVSASVKALTVDPYENIEKNYKIGETYEGIVTSIKDYGAFIQIQEGIEGLIHNSELDWVNRNVKPSTILSVSQKIKFKIVNIDKDSKRISLSYKAANSENPWDKIKNKIGQEVKTKVKNVTDKAVFLELIDSGLTGICHFRELSFNEDINELKKYKKNDVISVKIISIQDEKIRFSKRALDKDPLEWFKDNKKKVGSIITTRIHEVLKTGVKVAVDKDKKIITTIRKADLAKESADQRPEVFSPGNLLDAKLIELDLIGRKVKLSVKAMQQDEEKSLIKRFGENATKSGATLKDIFSSAIGKKKKKKEEK